MCEFNSFAGEYRDHALPNAAAVGLLRGEGRRRGGSGGADTAPGGRERRGHIQHEHVLHVPRHQALVLRDGGQSNSVRARRGPERWGHGEGAHEAFGNLLRRPGRVHWWQTRWRHG